MPKVFAEKHDSVLRNYLESSEGKIIGTERFVMP